MHAILAGKLMIITKENRRAQSLELIQSGLRNHLKTAWLMFKNGTD